MTEVDARAFQFFQQYFKSRIETVRQTHKGECGLACISMLSAYFGVSKTVKELRAAFNVPDDGMTIEELVAAGASAGLVLRPVKISLDDFKHLELPAILYVTNCHYVVLEEFRSGRLTIHDSLRGKYTLSTDSARSIYSGIAIEVGKKYEFRSDRETEQKVKMSSLWSNISGIKRSISIIITLIVLYQLLSMAPPFFARYIIDEVLRLRIDQTVYWVALSFAILAIIQATLSLLRGFFHIKLTSMLGCHLHTNLFSHLIKLPLSFFYNRHSGDITSRFNALGQLQLTYFESMSSFVIDSFQVILALFLMLQLSPMLALVALIGIALQLIIRLSTYSFLHKTYLAMGEAMGNYSTQFFETIKSPREIKVFQMEPVRTSLWRNKLIGVINSKARFDIANNWIRNTRELLGVLENILIYALAAFAVLDNELTIGALVAFIAFKQRFSMSASSLLEAIMNFKLLDAQLERISPIALEKEEGNIVLGSRRNNEHMQAKSARDRTTPPFLEVRNLSFHYPGSNTAIFSGLNFSMELGKVYAINGPSGSGKTTLLLCLMKFLTPTSGEILLNGINIEYIADYRNYFASVMQDDKLFEGSILENICAFSESPNFDRVVECAKKSCINESIENMPEKYNTYLGDIHKFLSGGQVQRVLIARALYKNAQMLFLDEVTSQLDIETEKSVNINLKKTEGLKIIVSHKPDINAIADGVIHLQSGKAS